MPESGLETNTETYCEKTKTDEIVCWGPDQKLGLTDREHVK